MCRTDEQKTAGGKTEQLFKAGSVWESCLTKDICKAYPADEELLPAPTIGLPQQGEEAEGKACRRPRIARLKAVNFGQSGARHPARERAIKFWHTSAEKGAAAFADRRDATAQHNGIPGLRRSQPLGQAAFDPGNFPAQGTNRLLRHGRPCHGVCSGFSYLFLLCSYRFQRRTKESTRILFLDLLCSVPPGSRETGCSRILKRKPLYARAKDTKWHASIRHAPGTTSFRRHSASSSFWRWKPMPICRKSSASSLATSSSRSPSFRPRRSWTIWRWRRRSTCSACSRGAALPSAGTRRQARGRTASRSTGARSWTIGPRTRRP